jgi:acyl transferase domain-containing protein
MIIDLTFSDQRVVRPGAGMLTLEGRCKTLDAAADGYVRAEDCIVFLLNAALETDGTQGPQVFVSGSAVNQDGRSSSLTAPNGPSQQQVQCSPVDRNSFCRVTMNVTSRSPWKGAKCIIP